MHTNNNNNNNNNNSNVTVHRDDYRQQQQQPPPPPRFAPVRTGASYCPVPGGGGGTVFLSGPKTLTMSNVNNVGFNTNASINNIPATALKPRPLSQQQQQQQQQQQPRQQQQQQQHVVIPIDQQQQQQQHNMHPVSIKPSPTNEQTITATSTTFPAGLITGSPLADILKTQQQKGSNKRWHLWGALSGVRAITPCLILAIFLLIVGSFYVGMVFHVSYYHHHEEQHVTDTNNNDNDDNLMIPLHRKDYDAFKKQNPHPETSASATTTTTTMLQLRSKALNLRAVSELMENIFFGVSPARQHSSHNNGNLFIEETLGIFKIYEDNLQQHQRHHLNTFSHLLMLLKPDIEDDKSTKFDNADNNNNNNNNNNGEEKEHHSILLIEDIAKITDYFRNPKRYNLRKRPHTDNDDDNNNNNDHVMKNFQLKVHQPFQYDNMHPSDDGGDYIVLIEYDLELYFHMQTNVLMHSISPLTVTGVDNVTTVIFGTRTDYICCCEIKKVRFCTEPSLPKEILFNINDNTADLFNFFLFYEPTTTTTTTTINATTTDTSNSAQNIDVKPKWKIAIKTRWKTMFETDLECYLNYMETIVMP